MLTGYVTNYVIADLICFVAAMAVAALTLWRTRNGNLRLQKVVLGKPTERSNP
jgi:hypothetical protein